MYNSESEVDDREKQEIKLQQPNSIYSSGYSAWTNREGELCEEHKINVVAFNCKSHALMYTK